MLRLDLPTESEWIACPHGVRLLCRPLTTALNHAALARARRRLAALPDAVRSDPDLAAGALHAEVVVALGEVAIEAWEGVGNADGTEAAPVSPEGIRALLSVPEIAAAFDAGLSAPIARLTAEGNA